MSLFDSIGDVFSVLIKMEDFKQDGKQAFVIRADCTSARDCPINSRSVNYVLREEICKTMHQTDLAVDVLLHWKELGLNEL